MAFAACTIFFAMDSSLFVKGLKFISFLRAFVPWWLARSRAHFLNVDNAARIRKNSKRLKSTISNQVWAISGWKLIISPMVEDYKM